MFIIHLEGTRYIVAKCIAESALEFEAYSLVSENLKI